MPTVHCAATGPNKAALPVPAVDGDRALLGDAGCLGGALREVCPRLSQLCRSVKGGVSVSAQV